MAGPATIPLLELADADLSGKTVIIRMDFNCPPNRDTTPPSLRDTTRIDDHIDSTIFPLFGDERNPPKNAPKNIVILAHQGRRGRPDFTTLRAHYEHCRTRLLPKGITTLYKWYELRDEEVFELGDRAVASEEVLDRIKTLRERTVLLLENVRFSESENKIKGQQKEDFASDPLIRMLAEVPNRIVALDGFSVAHRDQASVVGLANLGPLYAGPVVVREIRYLWEAISHPVLPMVLVVGGAKVDDTIHGVGRFLARNGSTQVVLGGLVGLTFLYAKGKKLNAATLRNVEKAAGGDLGAAVKDAQDLLEMYGEEKIKLPTDLAFATAPGYPHTRQTVSAEHASDAPVEIGDIGIATIGAYNYEIAKSRTVVMNGPMGRYEDKGLCLGTDEILRYAALAAGENGTNVLIGGGDTGAALRSSPIPHDHANRVKACSSGKAFLEVLASGTVEALPGVRALARTNGRSK